MSIPLLALLFSSGAIIGSFLNVVILRFGSDRGIVWQRSACPHCQQILRWWELVPIVSFLALRGKCQRCGGVITWQYPLIELLTGILVVAVFNVSPLNARTELAMSVTAAIACLLVVLGMIDLKTFLLPDPYIVGLCLLVAIFLWLRPAWQPYQSVSGIAVGAGFLFLLWLVTRGQGIGLGDVKLMIPLGALFGPLGTLTLLAMAFGGGALIGSWLLVRGRATMKTAVPFGPFLTIAAVLLLCFPSLPTQLLTLLWA